MPGSAKGCAGVSEGHGADDVVMRGKDRDGRSEKVVCFSEFDNFDCKGLF